MVPPHLSLSLRTAFAMLLLTYASAFLTVLPAVSPSSTAPHQPLGKPSSSLPRNAMPALFLSRRRDKETAASSVAVPESVDHHRAAVPKWEVLDEYDEASKKDNTKMFEEMIAMRDKLFYKIQKELGLTEDKTFTDLKEIKGEGDARLGEILNYRGDKIEWGVRSWIGRPAEAFHNIHLTMWCNEKTHAPHLGLVFAAVPKPFIYLDVVPRYDQAISPDYLWEVQQGINDACIGARRNQQDFIPFVSNDNYMRACQSSSSVCASFDNFDEYKRKAFPLAEQYVDYWIRMVKQAKPVASPNERAKLRSRDKLFRKYVIDRDPGNQFADRFLGRGKTDRYLLAMKGELPTALDASTAAANAVKTGGVLFVGCTGRTGRQVLLGAIDSGLTPITILTRSVDRPAVKELMEDPLLKPHINFVEADLDRPDTVEKALEGIQYVYLHATSPDLTIPPPEEITRAETLIAAAKKKDARHIVFNSHACTDHNPFKIDHITQKAAIEEVVKNSGIPFTILRPTLFMEELWKDYTRKAVMKKKVFPFALSDDTKLQLVSCRDMGVEAAKALLRPESSLDKTVDIAGDELTMSEVASAFGESMGEDVRYKHTKLYKLIARLLNRNLYNFIRFYEGEPYRAAIQQLTNERADGGFPELWSFSKFLAQTQWADKNRSLKNL